MRVYNIKRSPKMGDRKNTRERGLKNKLLKKNSWSLIKLRRLSYSGYAEDSFCILISQYFFQTIHDRYFFSKIRLVLSPIFYKLILWACWVKTQTCLRSKSKLVLTHVIYVLNIHANFNVNRMQFIIWL